MPLSEFMSALTRVSRNFLASGSYTPKFEQNSQYDQLNPKRSNSLEQYAVQHAREAMSAPLFAPNSPM